MASSSVAGSDDLVGIMMSVPTGGRGVDAVSRMYQEGSDEVKDLLKHETDIIFECRYCKNLYRSVANFIAHKRQFCRSLCRSTGVYEALAEHAEDVANKIMSNKDKDKRKPIKASRFNIVGTVQKKIQTTTLQDDLNRIELYTLPSIVRNAPETTFEDGYQAIRSSNPMMALKELLPDDSALLLMPQDDTRKRQTDMNLRKKAKVDVQEKTMTGNELIVLDYIYKDVLKHVNPASCKCLFPQCKETRPFSDILTMAYHLTIQHNRQMTSNDYAQIGRGKEGWYACFLCRNVSRSFSKMLLHLERDHKEIKDKHEKKKRTKIESLAPKLRKKALDQLNDRAGSLSPLSDSPDSNESRTSKPESVNTTPSLNSTPKSSQKAKRKLEETRSKTVEEDKDESEQKSQSLSNEAKSDDEQDVDDTTPPGSTRSQSTELTDSQAERRSRRVRRPKALFEFSELKNGPPKKRQKSSNDLPQLVDQNDTPPLVVPKAEVVDTEYPSVEEAGAVPEKEAPAPNISPIKAFSREALTQSIMRARTSSPAKQPSPKKTPEKRVFDRSGWVMPAESSGSSKSPLAKKSVSPKKPSPMKLVSMFGENGAARNPVKKLIIKPIINPQECSVTETAVDDDNNVAVAPLEVVEVAVEEEVVVPAVSVAPPPSEVAEGETKYPLYPNKKTKTDLDSLGVTFKPGDEEKFFKPLRKQDDCGNFVCMECIQTINGEEQARRHMLGHIRVVRFTCALCDCGAFFLEDLRQHLMKSGCPGIRFAPQHYLLREGPLVMTQESADELVQLVNNDIPGHYRYTNGKIVTDENHFPFYPDQSIERRIME